MRLLVLMHKVDTVGESRVQDHDHIDTRVCRKIILQLVHMGFLPLCNPPRHCMFPGKGMECAACDAVRLSCERESEQARCQTPAHPVKRLSVAENRRLRHVPAWAYSGE